MKKYSKGIYVKFKPEEVEILHNRMKEARVQNMSAYIRKMALNGYVIIPILSYQEVKKHHYGWDTMDFNDNVRKDFNYG